MTTKIYTIEDLLQQSNAPLSTLGIDALNIAIEAHLAFINKSVSEQMNLFCEETSDQRRIWGGNAPFAMKEVDEFGVARSEAPLAGVEIGFPLRKFSVSTGWSNEWLKRATAKELAVKVIGIQNAYFQRIQDELRFAIFNDDNYTYKDYLFDNTNLSVKAFLNADSADIPNSPSGTSFDGTTHNHYVGTVGASLAYTDIDTLISNVVEHGNPGVTLFVAPGGVSTLSGLASTKFVPLTHAVLVANTASDSTVAKMGEGIDRDNTLVGYWDGYPVNTRSWMPSGYILAIATGAAEKPLVFRVDKAEGTRGLVAMPEYGNPVITAKEMRAYFGVSAWNRAAGAVLDTAHQTNYIEPTLIR